MTQEEENTAVYAIVQLSIHDVDRSKCIHNSRVACFSRLEPSTSGSVSSPKTPFNEAGRS